MAEKEKEDEAINAARLEKASKELTKEGGAAKKGKVRRAVRQKRDSQRVDSKLEAKEPTIDD